MSLLNLIRESVQLVKEAETISRVWVPSQAADDFKHKLESRGIETRFVREESDGSIFVVREVLARIKQICPNCKSVSTINESAKRRRAHKSYYYKKKNEKSSPLAAYAKSEPKK